MLCHFTGSDQRQDTVRVGMLVVRFSGTLKMTTICSTSPCIDIRGNSVHTQYRHPQASSHCNIVHLKRDMETTSGGKRWDSLCCV